MPSDVGRVFRGNVPPNAPNQGDVWIDTGTTPRVMVFDGSSFREMADYSVGKVPSCRAYNSAAISVLHSTNTALTLDSERFDTDTMHSTTTNTSRITATTAGKYVITASIEWASNATGLRQIGLRVNGTTVIAWNGAPALATSAHVQTVSAIWDMAANDYVELLVYQNSGAALNVNATANYSPELSACWIGQTGTS